MKSISPPKFYTLLYSEKSLRVRAANRAITNEGVEVEYTCMHCEDIYGPWQEKYKWPDAVVVGYANDPVKITYISPMKADTSFRFSKQT